MGCKGVVVFTCSLGVVALDDGALGVDGPRIDGRALVAQQDLGIVDERRHPRCQRHAVVPLQGPGRSGHGTAGGAVAAAAGDAEAEAAESIATGVIVVA